jgi:hypothetical protein
MSFRDGGSRWALAALLSLPLLQVQPGGLETLKKIYDEVREMPSPPGQDFLNQDFFIGGPDDDDTNKDVHVAILIQAADGAYRMKIQVTYLERSLKDPRVKTSKATKTMTCAVGPTGLRLIDSEYEDREILRLASDILQAVKDKKRLIRGLEPTPRMEAIPGLLRLK